MLVNHKEYFMELPNNYSVSNMGLFQPNRKVNTQLRLDRLIYIWNLVTEKRFRSTIDLINDINNNLEKEKPYKMDRKTMNRLIQDLEDLQFVKIFQFRVKIYYDHVYSDRDQIKTIVVDGYQDVTEEEIESDPSLVNPTNKRDKPLPDT